MHREEIWTAQNKKLATISEEMRRMGDVVEGVGLWKVKARPRDAARQCQECEKR
jgi:hypothetical protein